VAEGYHGVHEKLVARFGTKGDALYTFVTCLLALVVSGLAAYIFKQPLLFPSLWPTALLFFEQPLAKPSSPRNTLIGHLVAILAGTLADAAGDDDADDRTRDPHRRQLGH
jgi:CBS domain-containing membrane protein